MNKLPNYIIALAINIALQAALYESGVPFPVVFFIGCVYWLWIWNLIEMRGR